MKESSIALVAFIINVWCCALHAQTLDSLIFGNTTSESAHALTTGWGPVTPNSWVESGGGIYPSNPSLTQPSEVVTGGLGQTARRLLPRTPYADVYGGEMSLTMTVDPVKQNYLTIKLWGSDTSSGIWFALNVDGKELGLRHGGDSAAPDMLFGNKQIVTFAPNQWVYRTMALPLRLTQGKTNVSLKIRSMGWISDYDSGAWFGKYNKLMASPSLSLYRIYTHLGSKLDVSGEAQGSGVALATPRAVENETTVINNIKSSVNSQLSSYLGTAASSQGIWNAAWLASCYDAREIQGESWISYGGSNTSATLVQKVIDIIDYHVGRQANNSGYLASFGNSSWGGGFGAMGDAVRILWPQINVSNTMSTTVAYGGSYGTISRTSGWSKALRASVDYGRYNRRGGLWGNQDVIGVGNTYMANRGLLLVDPANAILESEALRYLKEACGLLPWAGSDQTGGGPIPVKGTYPYGTSFYEVTSDGTTKDNSGFVGSDYGEMGASVFNWGLVSGNADILNRGMTMLRARANFRFPSADDNGYRVLQGANPIGVRNRTLPGHYGYLAREDGGVFIAAQGASVIGNDLMGYFQNAISDGQALRMMIGSKDPLMPKHWAAAKAQAATNVPVPMSPGAPDFAWVDEENMVVAAKSGENRIFANLYWAGPWYMGGWAKIFHLPAGEAPEFSEVQVDDVRYRPTGGFAKLGWRVESSTRQPFDNPESAYNGISFPQAYRSDLSSVPPNNPDAGKGTGYTLRYGHWLIGINAHHSANYDMVLPSNFAAALPINNLVSGATVSSATVSLAPKTSAVFYLPDVVDPAPRPSRPLFVTAKSTTQSIVLDWDNTAGAVTYNVKRATAAGGPYTTLGTVGTSLYSDLTAVSGTTYYYVVSALNGLGLEGGDSPEVSVSLKPSGLLDRASGGMASANLSNASYPPSNAFDGGSGTKWNSGTTGIAAWLQYDFGANLTWAVTRYDITSADTTNRDPLNWQFQGSNDGSTWTTLDSRSGENFASRAQTKSFTFSNTAGYRFHRLNVTAANGGLGYEIQLAELGLYASSEGLVPVPPAPADLTATSTDGNVFLQWGTTGIAASYNIKRSTSSSGPFTTIGTTDNSFFLDTSAPSSVTYHYVVTAVSAGGESAESNSASAVFGYPIPAAPTGFSATNGPQAGNITLRWDAVDGVPTYNVKRSTTSGSGYVTIASGLSDTLFLDTGRQNGVTYYYVVTAVVSGLESENSDQMAVTPQSYAWNGTSANWSVASNWGGTAPVNDSMLIFGGTPTTTSTTNNLSGFGITGLIFNAGASAFTLGGNSITLNGDISSYAANTQTISLGLTLSGNRTIHIDPGLVSISGVITDGANSFGLTKTGPGLLGLKASNTFDGGVSITSGTVGVGGSPGMSANLGTGTVTVYENGILRLGYQVTSNTNNTTITNPITLAGGAIFVDDAFQHLSGNLTLIAPGSLGSTYNSGNSSTAERDKGLFLDGVVSGDGDLSVRHSGIDSWHSYNTSIVHFTNNANTYTGVITVSPMSGTAGGNYLGIGASNALRFATVHLDGNNTSSAQNFGTSPLVFKSGLGTANVGALSGSADLVLTGYDMINHVYGSDPVILSVGGNGSDFEFSGAISGPGGITKTGNGVFTLSGINTYSGTTTINAGMLLLASPLSGPGNVVVNSGGTLVGSKGVAGALVVNNGGIVAPGGDDYGTFSPASLVLNSGGVLDFTLGPVSGSDRISVTSSYTAPSSGTVTLKFTPQAGFGPGSYPLITGASGIAANSFIIGTSAPAGYTYSLTASDGTLSLVVVGPPPMPTGLRAAAQSGSVTLAWDVAPGATGYTVFQSTTSGSGFSAVSTLADTSITISGLTNGQACFFHVTASNGNGSSVQSMEISATPQPNSWAAAPTSLDWSLASNWGGAVPINNALLTFGSSSATNLNNDLTGLTLGGLLFNNASAFTLSGNSILLSGDIINNSTSTQTINLQMTLVGTRTVTTNTGAVILNGAIDDAGLGHGLIKSGTGTLTLAGANSFTGGIALNAGTLVLSGASPGGSVAPIVLNAGSVQVSNANINNPVEVPAGTTVNLVKTAGLNRIYGNISGGGNIHESGNVNGLHLFGDNSGFTGTITSANSGSTARWRFNNENSGSAAAAWVLNNTNTDSYGFGFGAGTISFGSLAGSGTFRNDAAGTATLRVGDLGTNTTFSGTLVSNSGWMIGLLKVGSGTLTISGTNNTYEAATTVADGTLNVTGSIIGSAATVQSGATLAGSGTLGGTVTVNSGGNLSPGNGGSGAVGTLTVNGTFVPKAGSNLNFQLGSSSDQIALGLTSNYTAPTGGTAIINIAAATGFGTGTYTLISNSGAGMLQADHFSLGSLPESYVGTLSVTGNSLSVTLRIPGSTSWTGTSSGTWSDSSNWGGLPPLDGDTLIFGTSPATSTLTNDRSNMLLGDVVFNSGAAAYSISGNPVSLGGNITNNSTSTQIINLDLLLTGNRTIHTNTGSITLGGVISGGYGLTKTGTGILTLSGVNTYSGDTLLSEGSIAVSGTGTASYGPLGTGTLVLAGGTLRHASAGALYNHIVAQADTSSVIAETAGNSNYLDLYGNLTGSGNISTTASGNYGGTRLFGDNSGFTGTFTFGGGNSSRNKFGSASAGSAQARWVFYGNTDSPSALFGTGTLHLGELTGSAGNIRNNTGGSTIATFSIGALNTDSTFTGVFSSVGTIALTKVGSGILTLTNTHPYTGPTTIDGGTLNITGAITGTGAVSVNNNGTLAGTGSVAGATTVNSGGIIAPGNNGAGTFTVKGALALNAESRLNFELGTNSDTLILTSTYAGPAGGTATVNISALAGFGSGTYPLITGASGINAASFSLGTFPEGFTGVLEASAETLSLIVSDLPAPASLVAQGGVNQITLDWPAVSGALHYEVRRSVSSGSGFTSIATPTGDDFTDANVSNGVTYFYQVAAVNGSTGPPSSEASAIAVPPLTPAELAIPPITLNGIASSLTLATTTIGRTYQLQRSTTLLPDSWQDVGTAAAGNGGGLSLDDPSSPQPRCFYRVLIRP